MLTTVVSVPHLVVLTEILDDHVFLSSQHILALLFIATNSTRPLILQLAVNQPALSSAEVLPTVFNLSINTYLPCEFISEWFCK